MKADNSKKGISSKDISHEDLIQYLHLPEKIVAKELGICLTSLKKLCRQYGILRWPHRKIKAIDKKLNRFHTATQEASEREEKVGGGIRFLKSKRADLQCHRRDDSEHHQKDSSSSESSAASPSCSNSSFDTCSPRPVRMGTTGALSKREAVQAEDSDLTELTQSLSNSAPVNDVINELISAAGAGRRNGSGAAHPSRLLPHIVPLPDLTSRAGGGAESLKLDLTLPTELADLVSSGRATMKIVQNPGQPPELHLIPTGSIGLGGGDGHDQNDDGGIGHDEIDSSPQGLHCDSDMENAHEHPPAEDLAAFTSAEGLLEAKDFADSHVYNSLFALDRDGTEGAIAVVQTTMHDVSAPSHSSSGLCDGAVGVNLNAFRLCRESVDPSHMIPIPVADSVVPGGPAPTVGAGAICSGSIFSLGDNSSRAGEDFGRRAGQTSLSLQIPAATELGCVALPSADGLCQPESGSGPNDGWTWNFRLPSSTAGMSPGCQVTSMLMATQMQNAAASFAGSEGNQHSDSSRYVGEVLKNSADGCVTGCQQYDIVNTTDLSDRDLILALSQQ